MTFGSKHDKQRKITRFPANTELEANEYLSDIFTFERGGDFGIVQIDELRLG